METKIRQIPFDLKRALRIQNGEEEGKIVTATGHKVRIICTDTAGDFPITALIKDFTTQNEYPRTFTKDGRIFNNPTSDNCDLFLKIPIKQFDLKPFDKVLVRNNDEQKWIISFFSHYEECDTDTEDTANCMNTIWKECIPYNDDTKHLLNTNKPFKY